MEWLIWILGLIAVLAMAAAIARVFMKEGLSAQEHRGSRAVDTRKGRLSSSRWML